MSQGRHGSPLRSLSDGDTWGNVDRQDEPARRRRRRKNLVPVHFRICSQLAPFDTRSSDNYSRYIGLALERYSTAGITRERKDRAGRVEKNSCIVYTIVPFPIHNCRRSAQNLLQNILYMSLPPPRLDIFPPSPRFINPNPFLLFLFLLTTTTIRRTSHRVRFPTPPLSLIHI